MVLGRKLIGLEILAVVGWFLDQRTGDNYDKSECVRAHSALQAEVLAVLKVCYMQIKEEQKVL